MVELNWTYENFALFCAWVSGYLIGSIPFGLVLCYMAGFGDIRRIGSHNIGATNVLRTGNRFLAVLTVLLDGTKGIVAVLFLSPYFPFLTGLGCLLGHIFPIWLRFQGGKGVATVLGLFLILAWPVGLIVCLLWLVTAYLFRYSSLAALLSIGLSPVVAWFFIDGDHVFIILVMTLLIIVRHHRNIQNLWHGAEPRFDLTDQSIERTSTEDAK